MAAFDNLDASPRAAGGQRDLHGPEQLAADPLHSWRPELIVKLLRLATAVASVAVAAASFYWYTEGDYGLIALYWAFYVVLAVGAFYPLVPYSWRVFIAAGVMYTVAVQNLAVEGHAGVERVFLLLLIFTGALFSGRRGGIAALLLSAVTMAAFGVAYSIGLLPGRTLSPLTPAGWLATTVTLLLVGIFVITSVEYQANRLAAVVKVSQRLAQDVEAARNTLEEQVEERTNAAEQARHEAEVARQAIADEAWQSAAQAALAQAMSGEQGAVTLASRAIHQLCQTLNAPVGALFVATADGYRLIASHAYTQRKHLTTHFRPGEGLVGQAALEKQMIVLARVPADYMPISSSLVEITPRQIVAAPFMPIDGDQVLGVVELGLLEPLTELQAEFLSKALPAIGVGFHTARTRDQVHELLQQTQQQAQELASREEELRAINEELQTQTESLRESQARLRAQQAQLEATNAKLEERSAALQKQSSLLDQQNRDLRAAQQELERKSEELALANKYKSEFLANVSHELRTPLNSLLILARMLANNEAGNLTTDQVESANIIYNSGSDLLTLINEILDLSKVEAGRMEFRWAPMTLDSLADSIRVQFAHVAAEKGLDFFVSLADNLPPAVETDQQRVEQIVKNLLSNAFKFTQEGCVRLDITRAPAGIDLSGSGLTPEQAVALAVTDTGIGMSPEQQEIVFEAFQQADGSTSRQFGGTGLGLTISRELAARLGGQIGLRSEPGSGSTFTLYLPITRGLAQPAVTPAAPMPALARPGVEAPLPAPAPAAAIQDDRAAIRPGDRALLIVEDDARFAQLVANHGRKKGFKYLLAADGEAGLDLARRFRPDAIILDLKLPGMSGWDVLDSLKADSDTRHIPVHIMSAMNESLDALKMGAIGFLTKPVSPEALDSAFQRIEEVVARQIKNLLVVEDDAELRRGVRQLLSGSDVRISEAAEGRAALHLLRSQHFDCMILDLSLPDMTGYDVLSQMNADPTIEKCPVIVYTGQALTEEENLELMRHANTVIVKGVKSPERLLDETSLFLHRVVADMSEEKQRTLKQLHDREAALTGKHILVVDDDMRSAFALSRLLGVKGLKVTIARSGARALQVLESPEDVDLVLMDIMMPGMDGYEVIRRIRQQPRFRTLPILALTAKAMKGDQEKCMAAGANDYLSKPVDADRLLSMLRVWLYR